MNHLDTQTRILWKLLSRFLLSSLKHHLFFFQKIVQWYYLGKYFCIKSSMDRNSHNEEVLWIILRNKPTLLKNSGCSSFNKVSVDFSNTRGNIRDCQLIHSVPWTINLISGKSPELHIRMMRFDNLTGFISKQFAEFTTYIKFFLNKL